MDTLPQWHACGSSASAFSYILSECMLCVVIVMHTQVVHTLVQSVDLFLMCDRTASSLLFIHFVLHAIETVHLSGEDSCTIWPQPIACSGMFPATCHCMFRHALILFVEQTACEEQNNSCDLVWVCVFEWDVVLLMWLGEFVLVVSGVYVFEVCSGCLPVAQAVHSTSHL